ncbi:MAG: relaxase/mobilization nuclease domain-containing protein [Lachnospiraceae bacterium]|nr:relaxase/mobilization nuclease domain-containing protein [Lachnospiraceae bacterium]
MAMHLANAISYITDEEKTQRGALVGSHNCNIDTALQEMLATKRKFGKLDKRQGYHFIISFKKQEVRPETAMEITQKFVERYFSDDFQCLYATHDNTEHVHSHILFNSVSWRTGKKYRYEKGDWAREIQPIVNELCKEYGLSIQDIEVGTEEKSLRKWDKTKQGIFKWNRQISLDVEDSISFANSYDNFLKLMELKGYELKQKNGETFLKPMGEKRFIRMTDISSYYTRESIENQITKGFRRESNRGENRTPRIIRCRKNYKKYIPPTSYQKAFFAKMYRTGQLKRKPYSQMWRYRDEAARFEKLQSQYLYLCKQTIRSVEELKDRKEDISIHMATLDEQRHQIYKRRYPYKPALALLKIIEENENRASYYKEGSTFYAPNYEKWKEATEILIQKGYTASQIMEMKETFQRELASVAKAKRELRKEENLINDILLEKSRVQVVEKIMPALVAKENTKAADSIQNEISMEKKVLQKGGDAERAELVTAEIPAHIDTDYLKNQPAHNEKQKQLEQAR